MNITKEMIYYSPISFGKKTRLFWPLLDMVATYHSILTLCTLMILLFNWQFNLILILHVICQVYHLMGIGRAIKNYGKKKKREETKTIYTDDEILEEKDCYEAYMKQHTI